MKLHRLFESDDDIRNLPDEDKFGTQVCPFCGHDKYDDRAGGFLGGVPIVWCVKCNERYLLEPDDQ